MANAHKEAGGTLAAELENLQRMFPIKRGLRLLASGERFKRRARAGTLWVYVESDSDGKHYAIHETVFAKNEPRNETWWQWYFTRQVLQGWKKQGTQVERLGVVEGAIVPGVNIKTRKQWRVRAVIGYNLHDNVRAVYSKVHSRRH